MRASSKGAKVHHLPAGISIVHEDDDLIVVDKPAGILTAGLPGQDVESVFLHIKVYIRDQYKRRGTKVWIIHRLDKEASGLLVFAKSERAYAFLKEEFRAKRPHRLYAAVVEGEIESDSTRTLGKGASARKVAQPASGTVQSYLMEDEKGLVHSFKTPMDASRVAKLPGFRSNETEGRGDHPKPAVTHWRVMEAALGRSLLQVRLETGRKNQIRVHMKEVGHPIVGDRRYGAATDPIGRVCLHAAELGFAHPATGQVVRYRSPIPGPFYSLVGRQKGEVSQPAEAEPGPASPLPPAADARTGSWDHVAEWYSELIEDRKSDHHELVILPGVTRLLEVRPGQRVLDVACGQGVLAHRLAALGAHAVGVDAAPRLIESAKARGAANEEFLVGDAREVGGMELGPPFDAAACVMALMNIDPLAPVLSGIAGKLRQGGRFVGVILHPAFRSPGQTSWGWDDAGQSPGSKGRGARQYRRVDGYLSAGVSPITMNPGAVARGNAPVTTMTFHRPVQAYVKALADAGLLVDALEEWPSVRTSQPGPRAAEENRARREIPMFLALRAVRV